MVFLRISSADEQQLETIATMLLTEHMAIDVNIKRNIERAVLVDGKLQTHRVHLLTGKTKGLLFPAIDELLLNTFPNNMPEVYSLPIVHMDWDQSKQLGKEVKQV